jgi:hypothetical protein
MLRMNESFIITDITCGTGKVSRKSVNTTGKLIDFGNLESHKNISLPLQPTHKYV